jgi:hypothetical protein
MKVGCTVVKLTEPTLLGMPGYLNLPESKITTPALGWLEDSVIRSDTPAVGVAESFSTCPDIWIVW